MNIESTDKLSRTQSIILELNKAGLSYLTHQQFSQAFQYFKQSQKIVNSQLAVDATNLQVNKLAGITYNNLACYYKKTNKPKISLIYLNRALDIQVGIVEDWSATASTHLNICAIHSFIKQHEEAARHAEMAIKMLKKIQDEQQKNQEVKKHNEEQLKSIANLNILAHYNLAIQLQHLKRYEQSIQQFCISKQLAKKIGKKHTGIIMVCDESIVRLKQTMNQLKDRLVKLVTKKRQAQEKGHYLFMRKNKRNVLGSKHRQSGDKVNLSLAEKVKDLKIYDNKPHSVSKSAFRLRTTPKYKQAELYKSEHKDPRNTTFSHAS